jgi:pyruvate dehydrogenase E2 component (dihydrolipoamide acetyltransferase)
MVKEITIPKIGYTMEEGMVVKWLKKLGDAVKAGEPVLEIASDKANIEVEAPDDGILLKILAEEGEYIPVLQAVGLIGDADDKVSGDAKTKDETPVAAVPEMKPASMVPAVENTNQGNRLSPRARKFARENALTENKIPMEQGTGYKGMIVERDLKKLLDTPKAPAVVPANAQYRTPSTFKQVTAKRLTQSVQDIPQFFVGLDTNAENLLHLKQRIEEATQGRLSITGMLVKCVSCSIRDHKEKANVSWDNGKIALHPAIRMGVAVATEKGLVVAVIDSPDKKSLSDIDTELKALSQKARDGRLSMDEMTGSTFTISNLGMYGVDEFNAIINPPESGILAVGRTVKKAVVLKDDTIAIKPMMHLNLTVDHRVLDGADAALLLGSIKKYIEYPELML